MTKNIRVISGVVCFAIGYSPFAMNIFSNDKQDTNIGGVTTVASVNKIPFEAFSKSIEQVKSLYSYDELSNFNYSDKLSLAFNEKKSSIESVCKNSPVKIQQENKKRLSGVLSGVVLVKSEIKSNFYLDALRHRIPVKVVDSVIKKLSSKIDFKRALKRGDVFEIAYNAKNELIYSKIQTKNKAAAVYKFGNEKKPEYFFDNGEQVVAHLNNCAFGTPLRCGMKLTSGYGGRYHPITKVWHQHSGADFSANYGTPVYAIQDGLVKRACQYYNYGNCIDIQHRSGYASRYAHLSRCAVRGGAKIRKGQLIGYVGSSGSSTGPHLHLELLKNNVAINPFSIKMLPEEKGKNASNKFLLYKKQVDAVIKSAIKDA